MTGSALSSYLSHRGRWWTVYPFWSKGNRGVKLGPLAVFWYLHYEFGWSHRGRWSLAIYWGRRVIR